MSTPTQDRDIFSQAHPWTKALVITGIAIALLNMCFVWAMIFNQSKNADTLFEKHTQPTKAQEEKHGLKSKTEEDSAASSAASIVIDNSDLFYKKMVDEISIQNAIRIKQETVVLGFCYSLIAIGFSLFVMGIQGAITVSGGTESFGTVAIKASSPGLACILFASAIVAIGQVDLDGSSESAERDDEKINMAEREAEIKERLIHEETQARLEIIRAETRSEIELIEARAENRGGE